MFRETASTFWHDEECFLSRAEVNDAEWWRSKRAEEELWNLRGNNDGIELRGQFAFVIMAALLITN